MAKIKCYCKICDKEFYKYQSAVNAGRGIYCSKKCLWSDNGKRMKDLHDNGKLPPRLGEDNPNWKGRSAEKKCPICKKIFSSINITCSMDCGHILQSQKISRDGNGNWKGEDVYLRKNYKNLLSCIPNECQRCFKSGCKLVVHHIDRNRSNNNIENLEKLCYSCHTIEHLND